MRSILLHSSKDLRSAVSTTSSSMFRRDQWNHTVRTFSAGIRGTIQPNPSRFLSQSKNHPIRFTRRTIFINTETTPNPQSMKFLPGQEVLPEAFGTGMYFQRGDFREIDKSPLAKAILTVTGVKSIFLGKEFITITKNTDESWNILKPQIFTKILDFFSEGKPVIIDNPMVSDTTILDTDDEVVATIKELLETRVRPAVQEDGGDIFYVGFDPGNSLSHPDISLHYSFKSSEMKRIRFSYDTSLDYSHFKNVNPPRERPASARGIVQVRLAGSCVGCPSSSVTLRNGVENMLMHYIPEVNSR